MKIDFVLGLRGRLILLLLAAFTALTGMSLWHLIEHREKLLSHVSAGLLDNARLIAARQQHIATRAEAILNGLMLRPELAPDVPAGTCAQFLTARLTQAPEFIQAGRVRPAGDVSCAAVPATDHVSVADHSWFQQALRSHDMVVSDVLIGRILKRPTIAFAKAQRDTAGRVTGVFYLALDLTWLHHDLTETRLPEGAQLTVVDAGGDVVVRHPDLNDLTGKNIADQPLFRHVAAAPEGTFEETGLDGVRRLYAFTPLPETASGRLTLWLSLPKAVVAAPVERELWSSLAFALGMLVITLGLLMLVGNRMVVRPLMTMMRKTERFRAGDHAVRTGLPHTRDDIGQLARMLDETADAVQDGERKLAFSNRALRVLSAGNRTLLRSKAEQELLEQMCHAIVEAGGYRMAWVGYAEADKRVKLVASACTPVDFTDSLDISWDDTESGRGPTGTAIRKGVAVAVNDTLTDPAYAPWREQARQAGYASSLALPLRIKDKVIGAITLCATEPDAFDADVVALLNECADDLAFGIAARRADTELQDTQEALRVVEDRFRQVATASLDALFILVSLRDAQGAIVDFEFIDVNPNGEVLLGRSRDEVIGQKLCEMIPINRTDGFFDKYVAVVETGTPLEEEFPIDTPEIHAKWLRHQIVPVGDGIAIFSRDITPWKESAAQARRQDALRTQILEAAGEGIFGVDQEGRATFINPAALAMLQWTEADLIGEIMHDLHHHTRADGTPYPHEDCPLHAAYRDGKIHRVADEVYWRQDGTSFPVEYVTTPTRDEAGELTGAVVSFSDITVRRQAEQRLAESELRARSAMESMRDAFVIVEAAGGTITYWNAAATEIFGYAHEEAIGQGLHELLPAQRFRKAATAGMEHFAHTGEGAAIGKTTELFALHKDGHEFPIELSLSRMDLGGTRYAIGIARDITEKKAAAAELEAHRDHLEELVAERTAQLREAQGRAEAANQAKSAFLANMSHEIRTPMNAILGLTHLMKRAGTTPGQTERLDKIGNAGRHLLSIINDILDLSKIEAGKLQLEATNFALSAVLDNVASIISESASDKGLRVEIDRDAVPV
ncbi:MAG: PAS domain S-box protein [Sulfuritalea sp.]|nr:PAS domain S-box protein [Sulfuritalea sp.]